EAALAELYDRYATAVLGVAWRVLQNRSEAEDIVQEVFWRVWQNASQYQQQRGSFKNWLMRIARNKAIDVVRQRKVRPQPFESEEQQIQLEAQQYSEANTADEAALNLIHRDVRQALANLPQEQATIVQLAYFGGLTRREIAQQTNTPLGTVHTRARLALKKLGQHLRDKGLIE
ncbi:MAG: sigma-70 family RNA polymerase sigma factor, partial [Chloroflexota bacterium]